MESKEQIIHRQNEEMYLGKNTDKGVIEAVNYLTFEGSTGGNYHNRVQSARGKADKCEVCDKPAKRYEWANMTGKYEDVNDYKMMCVSCHHLHDGHRHNLPNRKQQPNINKRKLLDGQLK